MLVVLTHREEESGAREAAAVTEKGAAEAPVKITIACLEAWCLKMTVLVAECEPAVQVLMIAVKLTRQEETVVTGKPRNDSKCRGPWESAHQLVQGLLFTRVASMEKRHQATLSPSSPLVQWSFRHCGWSLTRCDIFKDKWTLLRKLCDDVSTEVPSLSWDKTILFHVPGLNQ